MDTFRALCATFPAGIYLLKVSNKKARARCEICSELTIKIPERRHLIVNFEHVITGWVQSN